MTRPAAAAVTVEVGVVVYPHSRSVYVWALQIGADAVVDRGPATLAAASALLNGGAGAVTLPGGGTIAVPTPEVGIAAAALAALVLSGVTTRARVAVAVPPTAVPRHLQLVRESP